MFSGKEIQPFRSLCFCFPFCFSRRNKCRWFSTNYRGFCTLCGPAAVTDTLWNISSCRKKPIKTDVSSVIGIVLSDISDLDKRKVGGRYPSKVFVILCFHVKYIFKRLLCWSCFRDIRDTLVSRSIEPTINVIVISTKLWSSGNSRAFLLTFVA